MALSTGKIELTLTLKEHLATVLEERSGALIDGDTDRHAARLEPDIGADRQKLLAFERQRIGFLLFGTTDVDARRNVHRPGTGPVDGRVAGRHAFHAEPRVTVAIGAGFARCAISRVPECLAIEHRKHGRIGAVIVLHGLCPTAHEIIAGHSLR
jgi:hypothetical protein